MTYSVFGRGARALAPITALAGFIAMSSANAQSLSTLMFFNGSRAVGNVTLGTDGALYGVASESTIGAGATAGLIYRLSSDGTGITTIYQYGRLGVYTGGGPRGTLAVDSGGMLYGVTAYSGIDTTFGFAKGTGTIFKVSQSGANYQKLHEFGDFTNTTAPFINADGATPTGSILLASDGMLYGTTPSGGANGMGTVFKIATDGSGFQVLHSFAAPSDTHNIDDRVINADGAQSISRLFLANNGDLYGVTGVGGANGTGVIYRLHRDGTGFNVIFAFDPSPDIDTTTGAIKTNNTGGYPAGGVIQASNGYLYGTTNVLGATGFGNIYRILPDGNDFSVLKSLDATTGANPLGELIVANDGTIVGTTSSASTLASGALGAGTIYSISLDGAAFNTLYVFGTDGASPGTGVIQVSNNAMFGTTTQGSPYGLGTVFRFGDATNRPALGTPAPVNTGGGAMEWWLLALLAAIGLAKFRVHRSAR